MDPKIPNFNQSFAYKMNDFFFYYNRSSEKHYIRDYFVCINSLIIISSQQFFSYV